MADERDELDDTLSDPEAFDEGGELDPPPRDLVTALTEQTEGADEGGAGAATGDQAQADQTPGGQAAGSQTPGGDQPVAAPAHWPQAHRAEFEKLPPGQQKFIVDRHNEMEAAHTRRSQQIAPVRRLIEHWEPMLAQYNQHPTQTIDTALRYMNRLLGGNNSQRIQVLRELVEGFGVDFNDGLDPRRDAFGARRAAREENAPLVDELRRIRGDLDGMRRGAATAAEQEGDRKVAAFRDAKDSDGNLLHPHFAEVEKNMEYLAQARIAARQPFELQELYDQACLITPAVKAKIDAAATVRTSDGKARPGKGRRAGRPSKPASLKGSGREGRAHGRTLDETLRANWDKLSEGAE